jgi:hypothetical protein
VPALVERALAISKSIADEACAGVVDDDEEQDLSQDLSQELSQDLQELSQDDIVESVEELTDLDDQPLFHQDPSAPQIIQDSPSASASARMSLTFTSYFAVVHHRACGSYNNNVYFESLNVPV